MSFTREAKDDRRVLVRTAQYRDVKVDKRPLSAMTPKVQDNKKSTDAGQQITVRKAEPEITPQEQLAGQANFWQELAEADAKKAMEEQAPVVVASREPINVERVNERMRARTNIPAEPPKVTAKELKEQAIQKALVSANRQTVTKETKKPDRVRLTWGRILLAFSCAAAMVCAIVYFVNLTAPDVSLKVAAMQSGIEATYPSFTPRDYNLSDITSEENKVTLTFRGNDGTSSYTLTEEKSSWDSNALLSNYISPYYAEDYTMVREQGLTLYMVKDGASWVNNGILYKLKVNSGALTKKQIKTIATSL